MSGVKGRSGRKPTDRTLLKRSELRIDERFPAILDAYIQKGLAGNEAILIDLVNRKLGKPKQAIDVTGEISFSTDLLLRRFREAMEEHERKLLSTPDDA